MPNLNRWWGRIGREKLKRKVAERLGCHAYSSPGQGGLDKKLAAHLPRTGFFVEAGANDGFHQSNTYRLEILAGWKGILIEPVPYLAAECRKERPNSEVFECALVGDPETRSVRIQTAGLMSIVPGARKSPERDAEHILRGLALQGLTTSETIEVPARTLESILDEVNPPRINFLSLDLEGYEPTALEGLNLEKYRPDLILVETTFEDEVAAVLSPHYENLGMLSHHDTLYRIRTQ